MRRPSECQRMSPQKMSFDIIKPSWIRHRLPGRIFFIEIVEAGESQAGDASARLLRTNPRQLNSRYSMENLTGIWAIQPSVFELIIQAQRHGIKQAADVPLSAYSMQMFHYQHIQYSEKARRPLFRYMVYSINTTALYCGCSVARRLKTLHLFLSRLC